MQNAPTNSLIEHLRLTVLPPDEAGDGELLGRFVERHDEAAFATLVHRHGPMVWGVCRRLLDHHDAEDAFQATFLVLARKAASVRSRETAGNWLYGVAHQTALHARRTAARRRAKEVQVTTIPDAGAVEPDPWADLQPLLDEELSRLPDIYRTVIVLCDLEGRTRKEVASRLGVPEGTVAGRIARARTLLARRLTRRGVALSGGALVAVLTRQGASAGVPNTVVVSTIKAARLVAAGKSAGTGAVSVKVAALTEGVLKAMLFNKLKAALAVVLMLGFVAAGVTLVTDRTAAGQDDKKPVAEKSVEPAVKQEKEAFTAWGKEVDGLQAGLGFPPGEKRTYSQGETVKLVLRVRNVGKEAVEFKHIWAFFVENPPKITDADGKVVQLPNYRTRDRELHMPRSSNVLPGKEVELYHWTFDLQPNGEDSSRSFIHGTGKFSLQCERIVGPTWLNPDHPNPTLSKLATGKLELEVRSAPPPAAEKKDPQKEREAFTAWGKEVDGLQMGLGYRPDENRVYNHGETVKLIVRVRNVGKGSVKFQYPSHHFIENPPTVVDEKGEAVALKGIALPGKPRLVEAELAPEKEIDLCELNLDLRSASEVGNDRPWTLHGTGKFQIRVIGSGSVFDLGKSDLPLGDKFATGKLELEVRPTPPAPADKK